MAKEQNLALNPTKISGQCGRLLCCLGYEYETYCSLRKCLPKCGRHVKCGDTEGEVVKLNILDGTVTIKTDDNQEIVVKGEDITPGDTTERSKKPAKPVETKPKSTQKSHHPPDKSEQRQRRTDVKEKDKHKKEKS
jgi:hypothetical protein